LRFRQQAELQSPGFVFTIKPCGLIAVEARKVQMRILLVEDHRDSAMVTQRLLKGYGHDVEVAGSADGAMLLCKSNPFDLLISDIGLPDGNGWNLMVEIRRLYPIRGIALSGMAFEADAEKSLSAGFDAHLNKPVDFMNLVAAMKAIEDTLPSTITFGT
jgi:two-component system CheB/CheR fusion protein